MVTPIFAWVMASCVMENRHQNEKCYDEIEVCAQIMITNIGLIMNIIVRSPKEKDNLHFCMY